MEKIVEVEMEMEVVKEVEVLPTPADARDAMTADAMMTDDAVEDPTPTPIPTEIPCAIAPTATPTPTGSPVTINDSRTHAHSVVYSNMHADAIPHADSNTNSYALTQAHLPSSIIEVRHGTKSSRCSSLLTEANSIGDY